jgi:TolB protein
MRLTSSFTGLLLSTAAALSLVGSALVAAAQAPAQTPAPTRGPGLPAPAPAAAADRPQDPLGTLVVTPGTSRQLPRIAVLPSLSADPADVLLRSVVQRDLDLCGEFELLPDSAAPEAAFAEGATVDVKRWEKAGALAVVEVSAKTSGDNTALSAQAYLVKTGTTAVLDKMLTVKAPGLRAEAHRLADLLIGALTGQNGGFASQLTFTSGVRDVRRAYLIDADGHDLRAVSPPNEVAIGSAIGKGGEPYWISSVGLNEFRIRTAKGPVTLPIEGSVYGLAFSKDRSHVAVSMAVRHAIQVFVGSDFSGLQLASTVVTALEPTFTPGGKLAFAGAGRFGQRLYVDGKPISPEGVFASAPTFCNHPDGVRALFAAGAGKIKDIMLTGEQGGGLVRLTQSQGSNTTPACSPDGRLVAFFSTRTSGEGPGLYVMRIDGQRSRRISTMLGDSLQWAALPAPAPPAPPPANASPAASRSTAAPKK